MRRCSVPGCRNDATHYDPIDKDRICKEHLEHFQKCGIHTEYREITYAVVNSKPGKPWSPCTGAGCNHPSHANAAAE